MALLAARDLSFGYQDSTPIVAGWTHDFPPAAMTALTGPSGCGKSTLLYLLGLMLGPSGGEIEIDGCAVSTLRDHERAQLRASTFGFVFQDAALDPRRSVLENVTEVCLYRRERFGSHRERAVFLLEEFGVGMRADVKPTRVSGGQAQRIALCRALLHQPKVVLADEPTGNLDPQSRDVVISALEHAANDGATVVVVTHDPLVSERCDREIRLPPPPAAVAG